MVPILLQKIKVRLNCLKVTIVELVKKKKWHNIPLKKISQLQCVAKNIFRPKEIPPPCLFNAHSLRMGSSGRHVQKLCLALKL